MKKTLTLLKQLVALAPLKRRQSDCGVIYVPRYVDDKLQWRVVNVSRKVWETGNIKVGDHVIILAGKEHAHEFSDGIIITDSRHLVAVVITDDEDGNNGTDAKALRASAVGS